jgi:hypothetical protein
MNCAWLSTKALDYRGDVTLTLKSGERIEAFIFNCHTGATLAESWVQYFTPSAPEKRKVGYAEIARIEFSGKDRAAGKHWEDWVKAYNAKKAAGENEHRARAGGAGVTLQWSEDSDQLSVTTDSELCWMESSQTS